MTNMSYCRFQNTYGDLLDCHDTVGDNLSEAEDRARRDLLLRCAEMLSDVGVEIDVHAAERTIETFCDDAQESEEEEEE